MTNLPFKKLRVWKKGLSLAKEIYQITKLFPSEERFGLTIQMRRAAVSIVSNIAEGSQRGSDKELSQFLRIAQGSLAELQTQLMIAVEVGFLDQSLIESKMMLSDEIGKMLTAFVVRLQTSNNR